MQTQITLPKKGEILIHCPALAMFPAKDIVLRYKPEQFLFEIIEHGKRVGWIVERSALSNIENGLYILPQNN